MYALGDFAEETLSDLLVRGVLGEIDRDEELLGFGIDVTDVYTTFMVEQDPVALRVLC